MANIKQINVGGTAYDIEALHFVTGSLDTPAQWKKYIDDLVGQGLQIVLDTKHASKEEPATTASASTMGKLYLVTLTGQVTGTYTEFVTIYDKGGIPEYLWEKIGTTEADLSNFVKIGTRTTAGPNTNVTGSAGEQTATGSATVSYQKSANATGSAGAVTGNATSTGTAGGFTINGSNFSFRGTDALIPVQMDIETPGSVDAHTYTPAGSITHAADSTATVLKGVKVSATTAVVNSVSAGTAASKKGVKVSTSTAPTASVGISGGVASGTNSANYNAIKSIALSASTTSTDGPQYVESVSYTKQTLTGTTSFNTDAIKNVKLTAGTTTSTGAVTYVESVTGGNATGTFNTGAIKSISGTKNYGFSASMSNVMYAPTVSSTGVLSWSVAAAGTQDAHTGDAAGTASVSYTTPTVVTKYLTGSGDAATKASVTISDGAATGNIKYMKNTGTAADSRTFVTGVTAASLTGTTTFVTSAIDSAALAEDTATTPTFAFNTDAIKGVSSTTVNVATGVSADGTTTAITAIGALGFSGTTATLSHTFHDTNYDAGVNCSDITGEITGSQTVTAHSHGYNAPAAHTHSITLTATDATGTASVAVSAHTHTLSGHTHSVVLNHTA